MTKHDRTQSEIEEMETALECQRDDMHGGFYEWKRGARGSYQTHVNGIELDVWQIGSLGWRFNALREGVYVGCEQGLISLDAACEAAVKFAEKYPDIRVKNA